MKFICLTQERLHRRGGKRLSGIRLKENSCLTMTVLQKQNYAVNIYKKLRYQTIDENEEEQKYA